MMVIRAVEAKDAGAVAELSGQLGYLRSADEVRTWVESVAARSEVCGFVAVVDGEICGWVEVALEFWLQEDAYAQIGGLVVRDGMRGMRIGQQLCEAAEQWARKRGVARMRVHSRVTRTEAHRFYLRDGYERVKTSEVFAKRLG